MSRIPSREEVLFSDALARPPAERGAFLEQACPDDPILRARVAALLAAHESPERLLGLDSTGAESTDPYDSDQPHA